MTNLVINVFSGGDNTYLGKTQIQISDYTGLFVKSATDFNDDDFWSKTSVLNNLVKGKWICLEKTEKKGPELLVDISWLSASQAAKGVLIGSWWDRQTNRQGCWKLVI